MRLLFFFSSLSFFLLKETESVSPHGHGQLLGVDGARAVGVEEVKGLAEKVFFFGLVVVFGEVGRSRRENVVEFRFRFSRHFDGRANSTRLCSLSLSHCLYLSPSLNKLTGSPASAPRTGRASRRRLPRLLPRERAWSSRGGPRRRRGGRRFADWVF